MFDMETNKTREEGYYWVKYKGFWVVALWDPADTFWECLPTDKLLDSSDLDEIDETTITRNEHGQES